MSIKNVFKIITHIVWIILLTALTQVGGFIWVLTLILCKLKQWKKRYVFIALYLLFNAVIIPPIANYFGRVRLPISKQGLKCKNITYPILFRNYVKPKLKKLLEDSALSLIEQDNIKITYLDANFPFYDGFPLLPHRSHNDGKKIDICFMYKTKNGLSTNKKPSISGYGVYVKKENIATKNCIEKGYWQYDFPKYLTLGTINNLDFDANATKKIITTFLSKSATQKIFIEPYLKTELKLNRYNKIRFHGCKAVRHDDHIHLQIK
ncbi:hypothetical protein [uncultured Lacinutrix sp.]|uniref:hypothetical protein n=1 Tax=uncultured Lacinutrix sp. TaxID=574032 RepID=UPI0026043540|nr:hypothetical protein [uncultured Lacinutrix sp.]